MMRKKPMLAYPVSSKPIDYTKDVYIQPKLDGVRCVIQYENGNVIAYSRTGKEWKNIKHITEGLQAFFRMYPTVILDGELYNHDLKNDFEKIISLVRKTKPTPEHRIEASRLVEFHCYDMIAEDVIFSKRNEFLQKVLFKGVASTPSKVKSVSTHIVLREDDAKVYHKRNLNKGYEGSIVRLDELYHCKRSHNLRKFKDFHDTEATLTGWVEGKGKRVGTIGKFTAIDAEGNEFGMPVMDKFKYLQENFNEMKTWVGKTATFTYFERTKAGSYRHPLFKCIRNYE
jgi:ATP-dependent DNA ligase